MQVSSLSYEVAAGKWSARFPAGDSPRTLVTAFGSSALADHPEVFIEVAKAYPRSLVIGCSSAGEIHGTTVRDDSLALTVTRFDRTDLVLASVDIKSPAESEDAGAALARQLAAKPGLRAVLVLGDGLVVNGSGLTRGLAKELGSEVVITGGLAADGFEFKKTWLTVGGALKRDIAAAIGFYGPSIVVGHGVSTDWITQPAEWVITRCEGNFIYELDYQPAIDAYRLGLADRADELPEVSVWFPLQIGIGTEAIVRTVIGVDEAEGALILAGEVNVGQRARLLNADLENLIEGGQQAARMATKTGAPVSVDCLALAVSCFGRRKILGSWSSEEIQAMREGINAQRTSVTGFYAYGQISPEANGPANLHNQTLSLTVFSEGRPVEHRAPRPTMPPVPTGFAVRNSLFDLATQQWSAALPEIDSPRTLVVAFGASELADDRTAIDALLARYPTSIVIGCSTAGEIMGDSVHDHTLAVAAARFAKTDLKLASEPISGIADSYSAGKRLAEQLTATPGLRGILMFSEGLEVNGSQLVRGINEVIAGSVPVIGGLAGDGTSFQRTWVLAGTQLESRIVAAVGLYGNHVVIGHGARGGWDRFGLKRTITRSQGNVLFELDGRPALQIYKEYLGERAKLLPAAALSLPLAVRDPASDIQNVRTILSIDEVAGSITLAGDVPTGHITQFMKADYERLVNGATHAALMAHEAGPPAASECLALAISCSGRRHMLGARTEEELEAVLETLRTDKARLVGFYAYGELLPAPGGVELQNQAMTLAVISESVTPVAKTERVRASVPPPVAMIAPTIEAVATAQTAVVEPKIITDVKVIRAATPPKGTNVSIYSPSYTAASAVATPEPAPRGPIVRVPRANLADVAIDETGAGDPRVIRIRGRITEAFKGEVASRLLHGRAILDLGDVQRITSFGVREWLAMFAGSIGLDECYMARCSESVVNQLTMIRKFDGGARVLSFFGPYLCDDCGKPFERLFDCELDEEEITTHSPESVRCPRCNGPGRFDDDPRSYFAFFAAHEPGPLADDVRHTHAQLCEQDQVRSAEDIEKIIDGDTTRVRVNGKLSLGIRWRRVFENIDGAIVVDLSAVTGVDSSGVQSLDLQLRALMAKHAITIEHTPLALLERFVGRPAPQIEIASVVVDGYCPACATSRTTTVRIDSYTSEPGREPIAVCKRCDGPLQLRLDRVFREYLALQKDPVAETAPAPVPVIEVVKPSPPRSAAKITVPRVIAVVVGIAVATTLVVKLTSRPSRGSQPVIAATITEVNPAPPPQGSAWIKNDDLPPPWVDRPFTMDTNVVFLVGEADAATIDTAITTARIVATKHLLAQLDDDLAAAPIHDLVAAHRSTDLDAAVARFATRYGRLADFERSDVASHTTSTGLHVYVRFKLPRATYDQILAAYRASYTFRGLEVAEVFPLLAIGTKGNLVVIKVAPKSAADLAGIVIGDVVLEVDATPVTTPLAFRTATRAAWQQPDVRERLNLVMVNGGTEKKVFIGQKRGRRR